MKKLIPLLFLLSALAVKAQYVTIPDTNFVKVLMNQCPTCMNGNQLDTTCSQAINLKYLYANSSKITDLTGVRYLKNLQSIFCGTNKLTTLPVLPGSVTYLDCTHNQITSIPALPNSLTEIDCSFNSLTSLPSLPNSLLKFFCPYNQLTGLPALPTTLNVLSCSNNKITTLPSIPASLAALGCGSNKLTVLPSLPSTMFDLTCEYNLLTSLPTLPDSLTNLWCWNNQLTSLPALPKKLKKLTCYNNKLTSLPDISALNEIDCTNNLLDSLPALPPTLTNLGCSSNKLYQLPVLPDSLKGLGCSNNHLTYLPSLPPALTSLECGDNQLTSLPYLPETFSVFRVQNNPGLQCIPFLKKYTGDINYFWIYGTAVKCLPNVIQHTGSIPAIDTLPVCDLFNNPFGCQIGWNIQGTVYKDLNTDCAYQSAEPKIFTTKINLYQSGTLQQSGYFSNGTYSFKTGRAAYQVEIDTTHFPFAVLCNTDTVVNVTSIDSLISRVDFGVQCKPGFDLGVQSVYCGWLRPSLVAGVNTGAGDLSNFYNGHCATGISGNVTISITGPAKYVSPAVAALTPSSATDHQVSWNINDFGATNFNSDFNIIVRTDTTALAGQQVCFTISATPTAGDNNPANNTLTQCFTVHNSLDPNEKEAYPDGNTDTAIKWLTYTIHFQNTGNDTALNIYINDTLDQHLDWTTFQLLSSSHKTITQLFTPGIVKFNFPNINLPDSNSNEPLSHGYVQYKVKLKNNLSIGTQIKNTAYIYFDFNTPVVTNTTLNTITTSVPTGGITAFSSADMKAMSVYPNPSTGLLNIFATGLKPEWITIYDLNGQKVREQKFAPQIDIGILTNGIYFIEVKDGNAVARTRFVKM